MQDFPKYYLANVPHDLRRRVLDLCFKRLWHEGLELLHENNIYDYNRDDLINFYNWAPTTLPQPAELPSPPDPEPSLVGRGACCAEADRSQSCHAEASERRQVPAEPLPPAPSIQPLPPPTTDNRPLATDNGQLTTDNAPLPPDPESHTPDPEPPAPIFKRRGKIASLPKSIRERVNVMLDENSTYEQIIEWLDQSGFPAVNKVNVHNWHHGGFKDWLREQERIENQSAQREWLGDIITQSQPGDLHHCIFTLFASQIMDSLFGMDTVQLKAGLAAKPRDYIALMNGFRRLDKQFTDAPEFQKFLAQQRERKKGRPGLSPEAAYDILRELRLDHLLARARECEEFKQQVKPG